MNSWIVQWTGEIPTNAPYGEDITFSADFDAIRLEVDKATSIHAEAPTDWGQVLERCSTMLAGTSKDLWLFWYGCRAAFETHGSAGLTAALKVCAQYCAEHWQGLYPPPTKAARRAAPFAWFVAQMESILTSEFLNTMPENQCQSLRSSFEIIQTLIDKELGEQAPSFRVFIRALPDSAHAPAGQKQQKTAQGKRATSKSDATKNTCNQHTGNHNTTVSPHAEQPIGSDSLSTESTSGTAQPLSQVTNDLSDKGISPVQRLDTRAMDVPAAPIFPQPVPSMSEASLTQLIRNTSEQTRQLASYFLALNPTDWKAYVLHRSVLWGTIIQLPDATHEGLTQIRPPAKERLQEYASALMNDQYAGVIQALEKTASHAPFWLDGHSMVIECLNALHAPMAAKVLTTCLRCFIDKFPQLLNYQFFDGTPFASDKTHTLLNSLDPHKKNTLPVFMATPPGTASNDMEKISEALDIMKEKGFHEAFHSFDALTLSKSRQGLLNALTKIHFCLMAGRPEAALTLATATYKQLEDWGMLEWEPELGAQLLGLLIKSPKLSADKRNELYQKLHWLHMETALALTVE